MLMRNRCNLSILMVHRYKNIIFEDEAFTNGRSSGVLFGMNERTNFETKKGTICVTTYRFGINTIDGECITLYQKDFPLEDY